MGARRIYRESERSLPRKTKRADNESERSGLPGNDYRDWG